MRKLRKKKSLSELERYKMTLDKINEAKKNDPLPKSWPELIVTKYDLLAEGYIMWAVIRGLSNGRVLLSMNTEKSETQSLGVNFFVEMLSSAIINTAIEFNMTPDCFLGKIAGEISDLEIREKI